MANAVGYGYLRLEAISGQPNSSLFSGIILNNTLPANNLVLSITFSGVTGSFQTTQFNLPAGSITAFSLVVSVPFSGSHSGSLTLSGPGGSDVSPFVSDASTQMLGFQCVIVGHAMPDCPYPSTPSSEWPVVGPI